MIPEDHKTAIISNGLHFMRSITEAYGADEGLRLWTTIADTLDPDIKGQLFLAMITGNYNDRIYLNGLSLAGQDNAVACIKAIREWDKRGPGLKEAKDMYDRLKQAVIHGNKSHEYLHVHHEKYGQALSAMRNAGINV